MESPVRIWATTKLILVFTQMASFLCAWCPSLMEICTCTIVHAKIKAPLGGTNPMYCTCAMKPFANAAVSAETH